ncbi:MAG: hypothetical protein ACYC5Q_06295 [Thermoleophilia bacterium]
MLAGEITWLESGAGVENVAGIAAQTRLFLSSPSGLRLAAHLANLLSAYNATDDVVPFFGDHRLAHTEAYFQLRNSVCLAYHGFYSQAFSTLRSVCELSLLQASLPEGNAISDEKLTLLRSMFPPDCVLPNADEVHWLLPVGFGAKQSPEQEASSLEEWAVDGCRTPRWPRMLKRLLDSETARRFDSETQLSARLGESLAGLDPYVHARGRLSSATGPANGNMLQFSRESLSLFGAQMMCATQVSIAVLLVAFLPTAASYPDAAAGFIDYGDLRQALSMLPLKDAELLRAIYNDRRG